MYTFQESDEGWLLNVDQAFFDYCNVICNRIEAYCFFFNFYYISTWHVNSLTVQVPFSLHICTGSTLVHEKWSLSLYGTKIPRESLWYIDSKLLYLKNTSPSLGSCSLVKPLYQCVCIQVFVCETKCVFLL